MKDFKWIVRENIPCWYELSWQEKPPAIILRIHQDFIKNFVAKFGNPLKEWPIVKSLKEEFKLDDFGSDFGKNIGFSGIFKRMGEKDDFIEFLIKIPRIKKRTDEKCSYCKGKKVDIFVDEKRKCGFCDGTGKKTIMDWNKAVLISASFTVFTSVLSWFSEKDTTASLPQLLEVETITRNGMHGGSLGGKVSIPLYNWLSSLGERIDFPEVSQAVKTAYAHMFGSVRYFSQYYFRAYAENGRFVIDCPGDATGLHPSDWHREVGRGYEFSCHNVDTAAQQISLLAGLAALHDKARKEIKIY